ncbi:Pectinesterase domain-containing protein/PMEI domain-containing protein [Cephalotus follicularis]|uniref:Pectinesterase n=1 Tax=Cephalotus follicularis TaxID=3775 RepID=A0A1Q3C1C4_CEPFO|nr:Pectinesterase domain-containing protein/PMEI domain-containing protein [Cephalotus follicularis]
MDKLPQIDQKHENQTSLLILSKRICTRSPPTHAYRLEPHMHDTFIKLLIAISLSPCHRPLLNSLTCLLTPALFALNTPLLFFTTSYPFLYSCSLLHSLQKKMSKFPFLLLLITICLCSSLGSSSKSGFLQSECLTVPSSEFVSSLISTIGTIRQVTFIVSKFANVFGDFRLSNAISDCLDLLDFSSDQLSWSVSASQTPNGKHNSTGDLSSDLRTWLSAALSNQATCIDGFDGTNSIVKSVVAGSLYQVSSLLRNLLTMVHPILGSQNVNKGGNGSGSGVGRRLKNNDQFPSWVTHGDRKMLQVNGVSADAVVAQDGTGNFTNVMDAVLAAPDYSMRRYVIYIKRGIYKEYVEIKKKKWNLMMIGDGMHVTVLSGNRSFVDGWTTFRSATFAVSGRGFIARDITFENTAGAEKHQAVALRSDSDLSVFYRCEMRGYQDTLYTHTMRQFYRECKISGTVDFIFGDATVVFQNCQLLAKKGLVDQRNTITAQGRKDPNQPTGFSIQFCNISADTDLAASLNTSATYLGRPWKLYSRTIIMQSYMSNAINPQGWLEWNGEFALDTLYYGEFMNYGPGAGLGSRVKWPGYHALNSSIEVANFTVAQFIEGNLWLPSTGVKYTAGLAV